MLTYVDTTKSQTHRSQQALKYCLLDPDDDHIGPFDRDIMCRLCQLEGREETPYHLATDCLRAWRTRMDYLGGYSFDPDDLLRWEPENLLKFFKHFDLENKPN